MKLIQLNVWEGRIGSHLIKFLASQKADILMLQEVVSSPEASTPFDFLQKLEKSIKPASICFCPVYDFTVNQHRVYWGTAIVAQSDMKAVYDEFTHYSYRQDFDFDYTGDAYNIRRFQHDTLTLPTGKEINLLTYHGYHDHTSKQGNPLTDQHCQRLADYIATLEGPVILSGDFNLAPDSPSLKPLNALLRNLCIENKIETTRNVLAKSMTTVDYIWVSDDITVNRFDVLPDLVSDHAALLLDFEV